MPSNNNRRVDEFWRVDVRPKAGSYHLRTRVAKTRSCHGFPQFSLRAVLVMILRLGACQVWSRLTNVNVVFQTCGLTNLI